MNQCPEELAMSDTITKQFSNALFAGIEPLIDDNAAEVKVALAAIEAMLSEAAGGNGRFKGLSRGELAQAVDRAMDEAVSSLSAILGCSARLAVCTAILQAGNTTSKSRNSIPLAA